tara:strand:- start:377 stop:883 length:507 start_codon:yes stop_codon:yes gene_type:complete
MITQIELDEVEKRLCSFIAKHRQANNRAISPVNKALVSKEDPLHVDTEGVMSELALCKALDVYPYELFDVRPRSAINGEDNGDVFYKGICIDVKVTKHKNGKLVCLHKNPAIDVVVLMTGEFGKYEIKGGVAVDEMFVDSNYGLPKGFSRKCYWLSQDRLKSLEELFD